VNFTVEYDESATIRNGSRSKFFSGFLFPKRTWLRDERMARSPPSCDDSSRRVATGPHHNHSLAINLEMDVRFLMQAMFRSFTRLVT
jgi:hypothetical protein